MRQPTPVRAAATTLATAAVAVGLAAGPAAPAGAIAPDTLFPTQGNPGYDVDHYDVRLDYAPATNHLAAVARLRATAAAPLSSFHLDLSGMRVAAVRVDGRPATWRRSGHELVVTPAHDVAGTFTTTVAYAGVPREHTDPDGSTEGWVRTSDGATALGEPVGTMTWLPSDNTPADKATYSFRVRVPRGVVAAANGDLVRRQTARRPHHVGLALARPDVDLPRDGRDRALRRPPVHRPPRPPAGGSRSGRSSTRPAGRPSRPAPCCRR